VSFIGSNNATDTNELHMNISDVMKSDRKYLSKEDVSQQGTIAVIAVVQIGEVGDDVKPIMSFMGGVLKSMVLNKTNAAILSSLFGDETDRWSGRQVVVYCDPNVQYQGQVVGGLKLRPALADPAGPAIAQEGLQRVEGNAYAAEQVATAQSMASHDKLVYGDSPMSDDDIPF
jgi:hypothetical protein